MGLGLFGPSGNRFFAFNQPFQVGKPFVLIAATVSAGCSLTVVFATALDLTERNTSLDVGASPCPGTYNAAVLDVRATWELSFPSVNPMRRYGRSTDVA
jgi:hypothetical protein